ncbi:hypothetical protein V5O48_018196 [Marasmius crinis-equi]|uniref:Uncharacterized protein n=1 Tax=Marasmius crinis-equi TaxID=585013 RepID=A0ABR3ELY2_9AGAR
MSVYHQRIFTLDCQVAHTDRESLKGLRDWLARKYSDARGVELEGKREMWVSGRSEAYLREQWEDQVAKQTKCLPRKSNLLGKKAVQEVLCLRTLVDMLEKKVCNLKAVVMDLNSNDWQHEQAVKELPEFQRKLAEG